MKNLKQHASFITIKGINNILQIQFPFRGMIPVIALTLFLAGSVVSQSSSPSPSPTAAPAPTPFWGSVQQLRELKLGETVSGTSAPGAYHGYQISLEAGTSVECKASGDTPVRMSVIIPDNDYPVPGIKVPEALVVSQNYILGSLYEPLVIVADKTSKYIIRAAFFEAAKYSIGCGMPHPTTDRDRKYVAAQKLSLEMSQAIAGKTVLIVRDTVRPKIEEQVAIYRSLNDKKSIAKSLYDLCGYYWGVGEFDKCLTPLREALTLFREVKSPDHISETMATISYVFQMLGNYQEALNFNIELLAASRASGSKVQEAENLWYLAGVYQALTDGQKSREYYEQAIAIWRSLNPRTSNSFRMELNALTSIGNLDRAVAMGEQPISLSRAPTVQDRQHALECYFKAMDIARKNPGVGISEDYFLRVIGNTYRELGNYSEALNYLNQARGKESPGPNNAEVIADIGKVYVAKGEYSKGIEFLDQGVAIRKQKDPTFPATVAKDYYTAGQTQKALDMLNEVLTIRRRTQELPAAAQLLYEIARIERDLGNFNNARTRIEEAIQIAESIRAKITAQALRTTFFSNVKPFYDFYTDLLMQMKKSQPEEDFESLALQTSDNARSRSLLDMLTLSGIDIKQGIDPALLAREKAVLAELAQKANQQNRLLLAKHTEEDAAKIEKEVSNLTGQYADVQAEIKTKSPRYAALTQPMALNTKQIQQLLDSGTILLEYSLGEKKSYLWAVSSDSVKSFDLPGRDEIENQARKAYELMTERNRQVKGEKVEQTQARAKAADAEYPKVAAVLSEMLLGPAANLIRNKRLVIVPDGVLSYIPFSALPQPKQEPNTVASASLGLYHEVVTLPSASTLARLREDTLTRKPASKMIAIFADPVFNQSDSRAGTSPKDTQAAAGSKHQNLAQSRDFERAVADVGLTAKETGGLPRLPFSRREADAIFSASPKALSIKVLDFNASKQQVFNSNLDQYRIVHFATHGLLDSQHPELSGVVLSLVDKNGGDIDGFLRLQDIYNLKLNADLVVLSACNTALGKEVKGEGLIGLTRGFMYAGAPRVVASLWKVDDAATAALMSIFYKKMLVENLRPAAALRAAQTEMMKQPRWRAPYYWAPFVLQGEWK